MLLRALCNPHQRRPLVHCTRFGVRVRRERVNPSLGARPLVAGAAARGARGRRAARGGRRLAWGGRARGPLAGRLHLAPFRGRQARAGSSAGRRSWSRRASSLAPEAGRRKWGGGFGWLRACGRLARAARRLGLLGRPASPPAELQFGRAANGAREPDKQTQN